MTIETETLQPTRIASRRSRGAKRDLSRSVLLPWLSPIAILLVWWFVSVAGIVGSKVLPSPVQVVAAAWELTLNGRLPQALVASLGRVLAGTIIGVALGLAAGLLAGYYRAGQIVVDKPLQMLRAVPFNALVPLFIVAFGIGEGMKVSLIAVGVLVPIYLNTFAGVRNVDSKLVEVGLVYRAPRYLIAYKILFLGALPSILTGLRFSLAIAWIALVTSETVNANAGIGYILAQAQRFVRTDQVFLCIVIYAFLGILTDYLVRLLEGRLLAWRNTYDGR
jgi:sulfonate transport system permease protein